MADFIAVIRRAVDGLSDNTPEMRVKVYERARAAVVRQLENMKPRPPEAMFQRQLDKLDAAIRQVEEEHAEALPAESPPELAEQVTVYEAPAELPAAAEDQIATESPAYFEPHAVEPPRVEQAAPTETPVDSEPAPARHESIDDFLEPAPAPEPTPEPMPVPPIEPVYAAPVVEQPVEAFVAATYPAEPQSAAHEETLPEPPVQQAEPYSQTVGPDDEEIAAAPVVDDGHQPVLENGHQEDREIKGRHENPVVEAEPLHAEFEAQVPPADQVAAAPSNWSVDIDKEPEVVIPADEEPVVPMPKVSYDESDIVSGFNEFVQREMNRTVVPPPPKKVAKEEFSWDAPFDDLPEIQKPAAFEQALEAKQKELATQAAAREVETPRQNAREELADLIGFERDLAAGAISPSTTATSDLPPDVTRAVSRLEGKSFRMQKKKKKSSINPAMIGFGVAAVLVLGGGAYGLWAYKDSIGAMVASIMPAGDTAKPADTPKTADKVADISATDKNADAAKATEVASLEADTGPQKFTQRLMPDGSEADTSKSKLPVDQALVEGKNVFGQTEPGKDVAATDTTAKATDSDKPAVEQAALGVTQKMFLYEERLGQASTVAVPGTIVWSGKADTVDGKPNPTIEAQIDIPERKITALMTFKRNTDPSLPASHIIEIVFAIPKDFPEGNVDGVQRIAFKQTEQDRGDSLVAVPAKITDDFHMVALNDDAEARKANLDLMKRAWIDIPITYRNGRRALITLEKGATGTAVFDKVLAEWSALGNQTAN